MSTDSTTCSSLLGHDSSNLTTDEQQLYEYEAQHFGFTPKSFCNGVYNGALDYIQKGLLELETAISEEFGHLMTPTQIKDAREIILSSMVNKLDKYFDIIEAFLTKNVLTVPDHVVLPEDKDQVAQDLTAEEELALDSEIKHMKDKILAIKFANSKLRQEMCLIDQLQTRFDEASMWLQKQESGYADSGVSDLKDHLMFVTQNVMDLVSKVHSMQDTERDKVTDTTS